MKKPKVVKTMTDETKWHSSLGEDLDDEDSVVALAHILADVKGIAIDEMGDTMTNTDLVSMLRCINRSESTEVRFLVDDLRVTVDGSRDVTVVTTKPNEAQ